MLLSEGVALSSFLQTFYPFPSRLNSPNLPLALAFFVDALVGDLHTGQPSPPAVFCVADTLVALICRFNSSHLPRSRRLLRCRRSSCRSADPPALLEASSRSIRSESSFSIVTYAQMNAFQTFQMNAFRTFQMPYDGRTAVPPWACRDCDFSLPICK